MTTGTVFFARSAVILSAVYAVLFISPVAAQSDSGAHRLRDTSRQLAWRMKEPPNPVDKETEAVLKQMRETPAGKRTELTKKYIQLLAKSSQELQHRGKEGIGEFGTDDSAILGILGSLHGTPTEKDIASFMCDEITEGHNLSEVCSQAALEEYHNAKDAFVRRELVRTFHNCARLGSKKMERALIDCLVKDSDPSVREYAAQELGDLNDRAGDSTIFDALAKAFSTDSNDHVKENSLTSLCMLKFHRVQAVPIVRQALHSSNVVVRIRAINACQILGADAKTLVPELAAVLRAPDAKTGVNTAHLSATHSLMSLGVLAAPAVPELRGALKEPVLRTYTLKALEEIGPPASAAVPDIIPFLKGDDPMTKTSAAKALGGIGPKSKAALPALKQALANPTPNDFDYVKAALGDAIKKIQAQ